MKNKKGFTLIELLAVIVILGLLMAVAVPNVTRYITQSRKKTLTATINSYISAIMNEINNLNYNFNEPNTIYAVPIECIDLERGGADPFGEWYQANDNYWAYVLIQYDEINSKYTYGFSFKDSAGYGLFPKITNKIKNDGSQILTDLAIERPQDDNLLSTVSIYRWLDSGFYVDDNTEFRVLLASGEGQKGDGVTTCTLKQKGKNNAHIKYWASRPIITDKFGLADLEINLNLDNEPIYNDRHNEKEITINGNGYTVTQNITSKDNLTWKDGKVPDLAYVFSSSNGAKVTISDLNIIGQTQTILLGHYINATYKNFNTELNRVNIIGLEVFTYSNDKAAAVFAYGNATINSCNIYDTKISSLETNSYRLFDFATTNFSNTVINDSKIGVVYAWEHAHLEINNSEIDSIITDTNAYSTGGLVIGAGTKVGTITATFGKKTAITIKAGATVETLDLSIVNLSMAKIVIEEGATVKNIIYPE